MSGKVKKFIYATSALSGTIIGVGIFALPYITSKVGFLVMLAYFLILGTLAILVHLFLGEISLKTPDLRRLPGFAKIYLGKWGERISFSSNIFGIFGSILAYLIIGGEFLNGFFSPIFGGNNLLYTLLYFILGSILIFFGIKIISKIEFWGLILFFLILIAIFFQGKPYLRTENLFISPQSKYLFLPYGAVLFALWGAVLIPGIEEMLGDNKKYLKKIIPTAIIAAIIVYLFFIYLILGITGPQTTKSAMIGLQKILGTKIAGLGLFFGFLTTFTSFVALGMYLRNVFIYDLKLEKNLSWLITCFLPLALFLAGIKSFIYIISFIGGVTVGIDGILILLMYRKIKPKWAFLSPILISIFLGGIIYEIIYFLK